ncbi:dnaJ homolog subfamily C member 16 isoform X1 [Tribolium castaneum]|uniref:dnaJ homolog subfamily C member 16 isoform X1 n=1 Tax=Tribolium castaneum TaxID=7070 RepID=UPI0001758755|nr:PREDICTED: dnaJ homolog subfamily C member 16 isoform X1 [Tribolium castaneum]|eukprot:XP_969135.2 PREDICTED: dnaJ homolog subfamily C member 16 isoform X1 [Tribolium castaneum]
MKWQSNSWIRCGYILVCLLGTALAELGNPYEILGVHRKASQSEIKKAYRQLAKEWHPDKTKDPEAEEKFVKIKQAYELLSDAERRNKFDNKGITEDDFYNNPEHPPFHTSNPFDDIFTAHGAHFNFQENDITFFHKLSISTRQYDKLIVPKSERTPHLIFFYTDWCFACLQTAPYCRKLVDKLEPLGVNFVTVHSGREPALARRLNIHALPCIVLLLDGNVFVYKETITSIQRIIEFLKNKLPYKLVPKLKHEDVEGFLNGWEDNRVRGLIFEPRQNIRLRYLITAYHFRHRVAFGQVLNKSICFYLPFSFVDSLEIRRKYQVPQDMDTVLLFNENTSSPMASLSMKDIPTSTLHHVVSLNQYLALPRLSSQEVLEALCPCEWNKPRKRLCVVLVTKASTSHDPHRQSFRIYAQNSPYNVEKVRFAYIYHDKQTEFVNSLIPEGEDVEPLLRIVILWRRDTSHVKYEWVNDKWEWENNLNQTTQKLESTISRLLRSSEALTYEALVNDLFDEHAKGIFGRIASKVGTFVESVYDGLSKDQILPALSIVGTIIFILAVGYFMAYLVRLEEESIQQQKAKAKSGNNNNDSNSSYQPELRLHELRAEKYNGLVRLLKPGCRTILLVVDMHSCRQLIPPFHKAVWPYRKNKTLMFSYMYIERGLSWYKELLQLSLPEERELNINPRNCVGTVLSLNGHRKYFCMFHAKHTERNARKQRSKMPTKFDEKDCESGTFIGFDSDSSESEEELLLQENLLDGLPNWLDRLFEGTTQRYHINYWPDFPNK